MNSKNYIGFINDHSGSMSSLRNAAMTDYNANIAAVKDAATREMLDTVVSVVGIGFPYGHDVTRQVVISNPHVLKPITHWAVNGGTPLYDGIGNMIELFDSLPDAKDPNVSFLVMVTTDGEEAHSRVYDMPKLAALIKARMALGNWTFVFRVPKNARMDRITGLGIPLDNIQPWDTTAAGMAASTKVTTQAMDSYFSLRSSGAKSTGSFYANAAAVNVAALEDISKKVSLYVVPSDHNGVEIRDFILTKRTEYLKGAAFYQLTKTESRVSHTKMILVRDRATGKVFGGKDARSMIGLPNDRNARLHPGDHKGFDLFIQSESVNRKLVADTGVIYWKEIGKPFTESDLSYLATKNATPVKPAVVQLPAVPVKTAPTKSPIPVTPRHEYFETREDARTYCASVGKVQKDIQRNTPGCVKERRWYV